MQARQIIALAPAVSLRHTAQRFGQGQAVAARAARSSQDGDGDAAVRMGATQYTAAPMAASPPPDPRAAQPAAVAAHLRRAARAEQAPWLHGEVARRMAERLAVIKAQPALVLDWWSALGRSRALLAERYPQARLVAVEPSDAMRAQSAAALRAPWWSPAHWRASAPRAVREADAPRDGSAQLVWANMMLHWSADPAVPFARWQAALAVDGFVMFSCFGPDTLRALHALYARLGWPPPGHDFIDMHDLGDALLASGFTDPVMDMEPLTLTWPDARSLLAELRTLGGNAATQRCAGLRTPRWRARLERELQAALAGDDGRLQLRFEIVYGHAFKPTPRATVAAETRVSVDALRGMLRSSGRRA